MGIRIKLEAGHPTSVEIDTVEEAIRFLQQFDGLPDKARLSVNQRPAVQKGRITVGPGGLPANVRLLIKELLARPEVTSQELAKTLGMVPKGLGPVVLALLNWGRKLGLSDREIVRKIRRRQNGDSVRILRLGTKLMNQIRQGEIVLPLE